MKLSLENKTKRITGHVEEVFFYKNILVNK